MSIALDRRALAEARRLPSLMPRGDLTINELPTLGLPLASDILPAWRNGETFQTTAGFIASLASPSSTTSLGIFNVRAYGALGNGTTDDTRSIQAAINAAVAVGGGVVYFPSGTYLIAGGGTNSQLYLGGNNVSLQGASRASSILKLAPFTPTSGILAILYDAGNWTDFSMFDLTINGGSCAGGGVILAGQGTHRTQVMRCRFINCGNGLGGAQGAYALSVGNSGATYATTSLSYDCIVSGNVFSANITGTLEVMLVGGWFNGSINDNEFENNQNGTGCIAIYAYCTNVSVTGNKFANNACPSYYNLGAQNITFANNIHSNMVGSYPFAEVILSKGIIIRDKFIGPTGIGISMFDYTGPIDLVHALAFTNSQEITIESDFIDLSGAISCQANSMAGTSLGFKQVHIRSNFYNSTAYAILVDATTVTQGGAGVTLPSDWHINGCKFDGTYSGSAIKVVSTLAYPLANICIIENDFAISNLSYAIILIAVNGVRVDRNNFIPNNNLALTLTGGATVSSSQYNVGGINPVGNVASPAYTSGVAALNPYPYACRVSVLGVGTTLVQRNGVTCGVLQGEYDVEVGDSITATGATSWNWFGK